MAHLPTELLRHVVERLPDAVTVSAAVRDASGAAVDMRLEYMNAAARAGQPDPQGAIGGLCSRLWPQMVENGSFAACMRVLDTGRPEVGMFWWTEAETYRPAGYDYKAVRLGPDRLLWVLRDSSEVVAQLERDRARFAAAFGAAPAGMAILTPDGSLSEVNTSMARIAGLERDQLAGVELGGLLPPVDRPAFERALAALFERGEQALDREHRLVRGDGALAWTRVSLTPVIDPDHDGRLAIAHVLDVTAAREAEARLAHAATHDALTGLPNRALLLDRLEAAHRRGVRSGRSCCLLLLDLDGFKLVNDTLGHAAGDRVLRIIAGRLTRALRPGDTVARLGGDEFAAICDDLDSAETASVEELCRRAALPIVVGDRTLSVRMSIGAATAVAGAGSTERLLNDADLALYEAKRRGGGAWAIFDRRMREAQTERRSLQHALRAALEQRREIEAWFQPIVDASSGRTVGIEALARWRRDGVVLAPGAFLPAAVDAGLGRTLSERVSELAVAQLAAWRDAEPSVAGALWLSINVFPHQLSERDFADRLRGLLDASALPPQALVVELTEESLLRSAQNTDDTLAAVRALGCRLAIDDFGTGYSSLAYLSQLPVDILKLDRLFVSGADADPRRMALLRTFAGLGAALDLEVVAEGVENGGEAGAVAAAGCGMAQGYHFARPAPAHDVWLTLRDTAT